jgi:hypothetical protein
MSTGRTLRMVCEKGRILPFGAVRLWDIGEIAKPSQAVWGEALLPYVGGGYAVTVISGALAVNDIKTGIVVERIAQERLHAVRLQYAKVICVGVLGECGEYDIKVEPTHEDWCSRYVQYGVPYQHAAGGMRTPCFRDDQYVVVGSEWTYDEWFVVVSFSIDDRILVFREDGTSVPCAVGRFASRRYWQRAIGTPFDALMDHYFGSAEA